MVAKPRRTQMARKAESEGKILNAAVELFACQGYVRTTLNQVGARAGYTGGLISNRYGSKKNLLRLVLKKVGSDFHALRVDEIVDETVSENGVRDALHRYVKIYLTSVTQQHSSVRALYVLMGEALGGMSDMQTEMAEVGRLGRANLAAIVQLGLTRGEFRNIKPTPLATLILAMLRGMTMQYLSDPKVMVMKHNIKLVSDAIDAYLGYGEGNK